MLRTVQLRPLVRGVDLLTEAILWLVLAAGPFTMGGVLPGAKPGLVIGAAALLILCGLRGLLASHEPFVVPRPVVALLLALVAYGCLQSVPLPVGWAAGLSPATHSLRANCLAAPSGSGDAGASEAARSLSLAPWEGADSLALGLAFVGVLVAAAGVAAHAGRRRRIAAWLVIVASAAAVLGIAQRIGGSGDRIFFLVSAPEGAFPFGPYVNRNHFAGLAALALPFGLGLAFSAWKSVQDRRPGAHWTELLSEISEGPIGRASFLLLMSGILFGAILLAGSRGGLVAAVAAVSPLLATSLLHSLRKRSAVRAGASMALAALPVAIAGALFLWLDPATLPARFRDPVSQTLRIPLWKDSFDLFVESPIFGIGAGAFQVVYPSRQSFPAALAFPYAESDLVCFAVEHGAIGIALLFCLATLCAGRVFRALREIRSTRRFLLLGAVGGVLALSVHAVYDFNCHIPGNGLVFAAALGLMLAWSRAPQGGHPRGLRTAIEPAEVAPRP